MGVKPMSPSANFTTYSLPPSWDAKSDAFERRSCSVPRPHNNRATSSLFRSLFCSRPCFQHSVDSEERDEEDAAVGSVAANEENLAQESESRDEGGNLRSELQSAMRHLEVRWQLFDEALSRFGDLEAMLAICAEKVRWRHHTANGVRDAHVAEDLRSLIARKLSMEVSIHRITQLSAGELGASFGRDGSGSGSGRRAQSKDNAQVRAALDLFHETTQDFGNDSLRCSRPCVLEQDTYILCNLRGEVVEEGMQFVIWEQYNSTWYIRACVSFPSNSTN